MDIDSRFRVFKSLALMVLNVCRTRARISRARRAALYHTLFFWTTVCVLQLVAVHVIIVLDLPNFRDTVVALFAAVALYTDGKVP